LRSTDSIQEKTGKPHNMVFEPANIPEGSVAFGNRLIESSYEINAKRTDKASTDVLDVQTGNLCRIAFPIFPMIIAI